MTRDKAAATIRVWDRAVRVLHWTLVSSIALAALSLIKYSRVHEPAGYVALAAVVLRVAWGVFGASHYARFRQFVRGPRASLGYARSVATGREPRYIGHNPLGGWMVVALMLCVIGLALTGWLYTTDMFWGDETVETIHRTLAWTLLGLVIAHIAGVIFTSIRHRENLVAAMVSGNKRAAEANDIT